MYQLYDIKGYTFYTELKIQKVNRYIIHLNATFFKPNCIEYNNFDLIIIYENLFKRFIVNTIAISTKQ